MMLNMIISQWVIHIMVCYNYVIFLLESSSRVVRSFVLPHVESMRSRIVRIRGHTNKTCSAVSPKPAQTEHSGEPAWPNRCSYCWKQPWPERTRVRCLVNSPWRLITHLSTILGLVFLSSCTSSGFFFLFISSTMVQGASSSWPAPTCWCCEPINGHNNLFRERSRGGGQEVSGATRRSRGVLRGLRGISGSHTEPLVAPGCLISDSRVFWSFRGGLRRCQKGFGGNLLKLSWKPFKCQNIPEAS